MAIRINLLPHREARRERQKKLFWFFTGLSFVAGAVLVGMVWTVLQGYIGNQIERNQFISAENRKLDNQIKEIATLRQEIDALRARLTAGEPVPYDVVTNPVDGIAEVFFTLSTALRGEAEDGYTLIYARAAAYLRPEHS